MRLACRSFHCEDKKTFRKYVGLLPIRIDCDARMCRPPTSVYHKTTLKVSSEREREEKIDVGSCFARSVTTWQRKEENCRAYLHVSSLFCCRDWRLTRANVPRNVCARRSTSLVLLLILSSIVDHGKRHDDNDDDDGGGDAEERFNIPSNNNDDGV